jgi:plastocyanin
MDDSTRPRFRRRRLGLWLAAALVAASFGAASALALRGVVAVTITSSGFSPQVLRVPAADSFPAWVNNDKVSHTVTFATGGSGCSVTIAAGSEAQAPCGSYSSCAKQVPFTVDGFPATTGTLDVEPEWRAVTLRSSARSIRKGGAITLSGVISYELPSPPSPALPQPVVIRSVASRGAGPVAKVMSSGGFHSTWHVRLRPSATATYEVEVAAQPKPGCTLWLVAKSGRVTVAVR